MISINNIKKMFTKSRGKKTSSELPKSEFPEAEKEHINELNTILNNCTQTINRKINSMVTRENVSNEIKELKGKLENVLKKINQGYIMKWDFYRICQILKDVLDWCVNNNKFSQEKTTKEVIKCIYEELTGKGKNSFNNDIKNLKKGKSVVLDIKMNDSSMTENAKKSLKNFLLSLMKFCFYRSEIKEFTRYGDIEKKECCGGTGVVRKIEYTGKNNKTKVRAIKTFKDSMYYDGDQKSQGLDSDLISYIKGPKLVEDTFKEDRRKYKKIIKKDKENKKIIKKDKENKKIIKKDKENKKIDDKKVKKAKEVKNKFSNLAIQKVRIKENEFVMISKLAKGDLSNFYCLDGFSKDTNNKNYVKLDSKDKVNQLFNDLTSGIRQLHEAGLVHGDIKPWNILVYQTKGENLKYKITDFDSVVKIKNYKDNKIHTPGYVPECYNTKDCIPNGEEAKKVDCYAICKTLREVFDNTENFEGKNSKEIQDYAKKLVSEYEKINSCAFN